MPQDHTDIREQDAHTVGLVFVGVLFAAVITKILELSSAATLPVAGISHLALAATITITSWIGYHNSANRSTYKIHFFNLPLVLFLIEMTHVYLYWLLATTAENAENSQSSAVPESLLTAGAFALYCVWDQIALMIRRSPKYGNLPRSSEQPNRMKVTGASLFIVLVMAAGVLIGNPTNTIFVVLVDTAFCLIAIFHRSAQHLVSRERTVETA